MPHYYFHLDNDDHIEDDEGTPFKTLEEAQCHALQVASELGANQTKQHNKDLWIIVTDDRREEVFRVSLAGKTGAIQ